MAFRRHGLLGPWLNTLGIGLPFSITVVVMTQIFISAPFLVRSARDGFSTIDGQLEETAKVDGAGTQHMDTHILLPLASRAVFTGLILTWARALGEFDATLWFAGNLEGKTRTMPLARYVGFEQGLGVALVLLVLLLLVSLVLLVLLRSFDQQTPH